MQLHYVLEYRDEAAAASARFPGEATRGHPLFSGGALLAWAACAALVAALLAPISRDAGLRGTVSAIVQSALVEVDRSTNPVFVGGVILVAIGGATCVCPVAYALALRRSPRPLHDRPVSFRLDDAGITLRSEAKDLSIARDGVVAVVELRKVFVIKTVGDLRLVLPKRACASPEAADALGDLLRRRVPSLAEATPEKQWGIAA
jgi:hypothetical protein